jgi:hypothetical protein
MQPQSAFRVSDKKKASDRASAASIRWFAASLFIFHSYWWLMTNLVVRDFYDAQFVKKYDFLRARMKENPGCLWLIMGGSRLEGDLRLALVQDRLRDPNSPLIFNFGLSGADLFREQTCLERIISNGVKPQRVGIEIVDAVMKRQSWFVEYPALIVRARRRELGEICRYSSNPAFVRKCWRESRLNPTSRYGMKFTHQTLLLRLVPVPFLSRLEKHFYDKWGWVRMPPAPIPPGEYRRGFEIAKTYLQGDMEHFSIAPVNDGALREMLDLCKKNGIDAFLFRTPEAKDYQALFSPGANAVLDSYLTKIENEYGVPMIDARSWELDPMYFTDGNHENATGAARFTSRFVDELLRTAKTRPL